MSKWREEIERGFVKIVEPYVGPIPAGRQPKWIVASSVCDANGCATYGEVLAECDSSEKAEYILGLIVKDL